MVPIESWIEARMSMSPLVFNVFASSLVRGKCKGAGKESSIKGGRCG